MFELFAIVKKIIDVGGQFLSLAEPWADTSTSTGRLMIAVLGGLADMEQRPKMTPSQKAEAIQRRNDGEDGADLARSYGVSPATIYRVTGKR